MGNSKNTVTIIGAGMSGIKAAVDLTNAGVDVVVLEGRDRLGGRLKTVRTSDGGCYDLGASWLHDSIINDVFNYAVEIGTDLYYDDSGYAWYCKDGEILPTEKSHRVFAETLQKAALVYSNSGLPDVTLKEFASSFVESKPLITDSNREIAPQMVRFMELWHGIPWNVMSTKFGLENHVGRDAFVRGGYDSVFKSVLGQANKSKLEIRLNTEVTKIIRRPSGTVEVKTLNGDTFESDYAVVTIPLGVLKGEYTKLFEPALPPQLSHTIDMTGFAALGKVVLEFESVFWRTDLDRFVVLADKNVDEYKAGPFAAPLFFVNGYLVFGRPVLISLMAPPTTQYLEKNLHKVMEIYRPALGQLRVDKSKPLPRVTGQYVTEWTQDKFARGSYSACMSGTTFEGSEIPFVEGAGNVRFAGEHTTADGAGCVHGAFVSGRREAARIIKEMREAKKPKSRL
ncbi:hypothetical protein TRICI_004738 [Trichomonascus ciferrii]|uniref:Amine oxidase domain-containing protein n=1 Tax=Trichomonascus ciferrii TaxID=44093 RepID=A0A642V073_9ASCO|nr:hypothetical protein TRICI_004738 [Trichomonascus ciferrii]